MPSESEMMADLAAADSSGDTALAQHIAGKIKAARAPAPSVGDALSTGATKGLGDRILARASALGAQQGQPRDAFQSFDVVTDRPVNEAQFETDRARILGERRQKGAAAEAAHPVAHGIGSVAPAVASMAIPGGAGWKGAAAIGGALGLTGSESDDPGTVAEEGALGAALAGGGTKLLQLLGKGIGAVGTKMLPKATALRDRLMNAVADRSASAADKTAKSVQGTAGAVKGQGRRILELLSREEALPASEIAANKAALETPAAQDLATNLAGSARDELPGKMAHIESSKALAEQAAADAAGARSPEAVKAMEKQMRGEVADRLLKRYLLPAAGGYAVGELSGGHGREGAVGGLLFRPGARAILRGVTSPGVTAPVSRAAVKLAQALANMGPTGIPERAGPLAEAEIEPRLAALIAALREKQSVAP